MKNAHKTRNSAFRIFTVGFVLYALVFWFGGCGYVVKVDRFLDDLAANVWTKGSEPEAHAQLGETEAEGRRRHLRNERIRQQEMMADLDMLIKF